MRRLIGAGLVGLALTVAAIFAKDLLVAFRLPAHRASSGAPIKRTSRVNGDFVYTAEFTARDGRSFQETARFPDDMGDEGTPLRIDYDVDFPRLNRFVDLPPTGNPKLQGGAIALLGLAGLILIFMPSRGEGRSDIRLALFFSCMAIPAVWLAFRVLYLLR